MWPEGSVSRLFNANFCIFPLFLYDSIAPRLRSSQLCERKRELEVSAATSAAEARERVAELRLSLLPEHQQQLLQVHHKIFASLVAGIGLIFVNLIFVLLFYVVILFANGRRHNTTE